MAKDKKGYTEITKGIKDPIPYSLSLEELKVNIGHNDVITSLINLFRCRSDFDDLVWKSNRKNPKLWFSKAALALVLIFACSLAPDITHHFAKKIANNAVEDIIPEGKNGQLAESDSVSSNKKR